MKDGTISEQGSHAELLKAAGDYSQMLTFDHTRTVKKQSSGDEAVTEDITEVPNG